MRRFLILFVFLAFTQPLFSQDYKLHPVYIYSFTKYIVWPDAYKSGDFRILVFGESPIIKELTTMANMKKTPDNRPILVNKIESTADIKKCHVLYVPAAKSKMLPEIMSKVGSQSILVITEEAGMGAKGSDINFIVKDGKLAFEINQGAMNKQSLKASIELTRLAIQI